MEQRNIDFEIPLTREQWNQLGRRAQALGPDDAGYAWAEDQPDHIQVFLRESEARGLWERFVSDPDNYGDDKLEMARFRFNDGRPYAELTAPAAADEPAVISIEEDAMEVGQERFVREKWHRLLDEAGVQQT